MKEELSLLEEDQQDHESVRFEAGLDLYSVYLRDAAHAAIEKIIDRAEARLAQEREEREKSFSS